jgi:hypothetical protein
MPGASPLENAQPPAPKFSTRVSFVDIDSAAGLLCDFLTALEAQGGATHPFMTYAQARAEKQLQLWGVTR